MNPIDALELIFLALLALGVWLVWLRLPPRQR
jgi:hypothetical protein